MEERRRRDDQRIDRIEKDVRDLSVKVTENAQLAHEIHEEMAVLREIAAGVKGLRMLGRLIMWLGGVIAASAATWNYFNGDF